MKNRALLLTAFTLMLTAFFSCTPEAEEDPVEFSLNGPIEVFQTETADYTVIPAAEQPGTRWEWFVEGASLSGVSADTRTATVSFPNMPPEDSVFIAATAITSGGSVSSPKVLGVYVEPFCVLDLNAYIGLFSCDEAGYDIYPVTFTKHPTMANTIVNDNFWDFAAEGAVVYYTLSGDFLEEVTVPRQDFEFGDGYVGWVEGSGTYDGCNNTMSIENKVFYEGAEYTIYHSFAPATKGTVYNITIKKSKEYFNRYR
ncbi:MAG: hypothetical protein RB288_00845 [Bacteroidales bacterium]|jgi:hypothetical protein|nr:hypothetical protein [Bacteroidales bacterium]